MTKRLPRLFLYLLGSLFLLNILQSIFTELMYDEAYYWYYSQQMAWGYFDHPPMVALLIKLGDLVFPGELGVRFMSCSLSTVTYLLIWLLIDHPKKNDYIPHFFLLLFSMTLFNAYGFLALPDTPLLFFTALFLWLYKQFLTEQKLGLALLLGLTMAALMYSKYHAALIIAFVLLSNIQLLKNKLLWVAVAVALLGYLPHLLWLYNHDFLTIKFHLFERPNHAYNFAEFTLGYVLNLVLIFGLLFPFAYWSLFKTKTKSPFERALNWLTYGFLIFFLFSSFSKRVQAQWVVVICIPMAILTFNQLITHQKMRSWIFGLGIASLVLVCYGRAFLIYQPLFPKVLETHGNKEWVTRLKKEAGDTPIIWQNNYRRASMYAFYSGNTSYSLNTLNYRLNQFNIDQSEQVFQNQKVVLMVKEKEAKHFDFEFKYKKGTSIKYKGVLIPNFKSYRNLEVHVNQDEISLNNLNDLKLSIYNPYEQAIALEDIALNVGYLDAFKNMKKLEKANVVLKNSEGITHLKAKDTTNLIVTLNKPTQGVPAFIKFGISEFSLDHGINSKSIKVKE